MQEATTEEDTILHVPMDSDDQTLVDDVAQQINNTGVKIDSHDQLAPLEDLHHNNRSISIPTQPVPLGVGGAMEPPFPDNKQIEEDVVGQDSTIPIDEEHDPLHFQTSLDINDLDRVDHGMSCHHNLDHLWTDIHSIHHMDSKNQKHNLKKKKKKKFKFLYHTSNKHTLKGFRSKTKGKRHHKCCYKKYLYKKKLRQIYFACNKKYRNVTTFHKHKHNPNKTNKTQHYKHTKYLCALCQHHKKHNVPNNSTTQNIDFKDLLSNIWDRIKYQVKESLAHLFLLLYHCFDFSLFVIFLNTILLYLFLFLLPMYWSRLNFDNFVWNDSTLHLLNDDFEIDSDFFVCDINNEFGIHFANNSLNIDDFANDLFLFQSDFELENNMLQDRSDLYFDDLNNFFVFNLFVVDLNHSLAIDPIYSISSQFGTIIDRNQLPQIDSHSIQLNCLPFIQLLIQLVANCRHFGAIGLLSQLIFLLLFPMKLLICSYALRVVVWLLSHTKFTEAQFVVVMEHCFGCWFWTIVQLLILCVAFAKRVRWFWLQFAVLLYSLAQVVVVVVVELCLNLSIKYKNLT